jgi:hypothetical protein
VLVKFRVELEKGQIMDPVPAAAEWRYEHPSPAGVAK